ncbi:MAG: kynureninase [Bacteroidales bacterium]|nr:kynureninase [Bacteroidales bacterium]
MKKEEIVSKAEELDRMDPLREFRDYFTLDDKRLVYLDGNSLGVLPRMTSVNLDRVINKEWGERLIRAYNEGWWTKPSDIGARIASLIGARPDEVIVCDSVSVNMFKILVSVLRQAEKKKTVVSDELNFGTDLYIIQGAIDLLGKGQKMKLMKSRDGIVVANDEIERSIDDDTALVSLSHVSFRSAFMYDMKKVTAAAHKHSALILWDLCHAVGAVPVDLNGADADFAVGCTYKYLNGGPGSTSFLYVRKDLQEKYLSPVWGWWADSDPFSFNTSFSPAPGMKKYLAGTVPILSSSTIDSSLDIFEKAGMERIRQKSLQMSSFLIGLADELLAPAGFSLGSPREDNLRGSHVSLKHPEAFRICKALTDDAEGRWTIIPDFRTPDNIRIGFAPLYNTFGEIAILVTELLRITSEKVYEKYSLEKGDVT